MPPGVVSPCAHPAKFAILNTLAREAWGGGLACEGMEHIRAYIAALNSAMDILAEAADMPASELTAVGMPDAAAESIAHLSQIYFGPTSFTRRQRRAVEGARRNGH